MTVKNLSNITFSGQTVKIVSCCQSKYLGQANTLATCEYADCEVKQIYVGCIDKQLCVEITNPEAI